MCQALLCLPAQHRKSVLIGNTANMKLTYSAKVTCEKEKEFSTKQTCHDEPNMSRQFKVKRWVTADFVNVSRRVSVKCNSTLMQIYIIPLILLRLTIQRNFTLETFNCKRVCESGNLEVFILNLQISKWRISKIGLLQECLVVQIQKIPKKLNGRKLK